MPEATEDGDVVTISINEGILYDVYGNTNSAFNSQTVWWKNVAMTVEDIVGEYEVYYVPYFDNADKEMFALDNITITENTEVKNGLIISNLYLAGSKIEATYDLATKTISIPEGQPLGTVTEVDTAAADTTTYGLMFVNAAADGDVEFEIMTEYDAIMCNGMWGVYTYDEAFENALAWWDVARSSMFVKPEPAAEEARAQKSFKLMKSNKSVNVKNAGSVKIVHKTTGKKLSWK